MSASIWTRTLKPGGFLDRHPLLIPAMFLSIAWAPYAIIFARSSIAFGDLGNPVAFPTLMYWLLLALQLFVCVISHSLALRTMIGLYAPLWLIFGSLAFFCLSPIWGMLTAADVRYPLFAMMICVLTSSVAFIVFTPKPKPWLWIELGLASILICLLRATGFWSVLPVLVGLLVFEIVKERKGSIRQDQPNTLPRLRTKLGAGTAAMASVIAVACGTAIAASLLGASTPIGEPSYTGDLIANDVTLEQITTNSLDRDLAMSAANALIEYQSLPVINITYAYPFYVVIFCVFLAYALVKKDWSALLVGLPQIAIFALSLIDPAHTTLAFILPAMAAQIMFFGAIMRNTQIIGEPPYRS